MNDTPPNPLAGIAANLPADTVPVYLDGSTPEHLIGAVEPVQAHGERHWRYVTPVGYRSPFNHRNQDDATDALVQQHLNGTDRDTVQPRLEPVDGADGVAGHNPMFEVYRCAPGCPQHPPVVVCAKDREPWPCGAITAVSAELEHVAATMREHAPTGDQVWEDCAALLAVRAKSLATASGAIQ